MKKILTLLACFLFLGLPAKTQTANSLLWKISKSNSPYHGYLFGTVHIQDSRVFNLPDSLLTKMKECDAAFFEMDFDSVSSKALNITQNEPRKKPVKELLTKSELTRIKKTLIKNKATYNDWEVDDAFSLYNKYNQKLYTRNDESTFLDGYLYGLARSFGKKTGGLESYEEQAGIESQFTDSMLKEMVLSIADNPLESDSVLKLLINAYINQDINVIDSLMNLHPQKHVDEFMVNKRNHIMTHRMDSILQSASPFVCVGAAHLAGPEGIINLMKNKGYTVEPVYSQRTGYYLQLLPKEDATVWKRCVDENAGFSIEMPGSASDMLFAGYAMKGYFDAGNGEVFMATALSVNPQKLKKDELIKKLLNNLKRKGNITSSNKTSYNGLEGLEAELIIENGVNFNVCFLTDSTKLYTLLVGKSNDKVSEKTKAKYFNSVQSVSIEKKGKEMFSDDKCAFSIVAPKGFKAAKTQSEEGTLLSPFSGWDDELQGIIYATCVQYEAGLYFPETDTVYSFSFEAVRNAMKGTLNYQKDTTILGYRSRHYKVTAPDGSYAHLYYILRTWRLYLLGATSTFQSKNDDVIAAVNSFRFIPFLPAVLKPYISPDGDFKLMLPEDFSESTDTTLSYGLTSINKTITSLDNNSGKWFKLTSQQLSDYDFFKNDSALLAHYSTQLGDDSLVSQSISKKNGVTSYNYVYQPSGNTVFLKHRLIVNGKTLYNLITLSGSNEEIDSLDNLVFDSFEITKENKNFNVFEDKKTALFADLQSTDSVTHASALSYFNSYTFDSTDINLLLKALNTQFIDEDDKYYSTRKSLYSKIYQLQTDQQKMGYIENEYKHMPDSGNIRVEALNQLIKINKPESFALWLKFLSQMPPKPEYPQGIYAAANNLYYDSVPLSSTLFPQLFDFISHPVCKNLFYGITPNCIKRGFISAEICKPYTDKIIEEANTELALTKAKPTSDETAYWSPSLDDAVLILSIMPADDRITAFHQQLITDEEYGNKVNSFIYLINNNVKFDKKHLERYLKVPANRITLYNRLLEINKQDAFPASFKNQKKLAEGDLCYTLEFDYELTNEKLDFLEVREINNQLYYLYRVWQNVNENISYLGVSGPHPKEEKTAFEQGAKTGLNWDAFDKKLIDEQFNKIIE